MQDFVGQYSVDWGLLMSAVVISLIPILIFFALVQKNLVCLLYTSIIPDCVEYGEWKTGLRNDGFQYAFVSLGNKIGMEIGRAHV